MRLHVFVMFFHSVTFTVANVTLVTSNFFPNPSLAALWNTTKIMMFIAQSISQVIIMYLIRQLSKPILVRKQETEEDEDDVDQSEASSFAFLLYVKKEGNVKMLKRPDQTSDLWASRNDLLHSQNVVTETYTDVYTETSPLAASKRSSINDANRLTTSGIRNSGGGSQFV